MQRRRGKLQIDCPGANGTLMVLARKNLRSKLAHAAHTERQNHVAVVRLRCDGADRGGKIRNEFDAPAGSPALRWSAQSSYKYR